jgi:hypothetical protein
MILNRRAIASKGGAKTSYQPFFDPMLKGDEKHPKGLTIFNIFFKNLQVGYKENSYIENRVMWLSSNNTLRLKMYILATVLCMVSFFCCATIAGRRYHDVSIAAILSAIEIKPGDIALWIPVGVEFDTASLWCPHLPFFYHADVIIDEDGQVMTSAPPQGCGSSSTIKDRIASGMWQKLVIVRNEHADVDAILERAYSLECEYDWVGFYLQWFDFFLCCSECLFFRLTPRPLDDYHCASFTAYCAGFDNPHTMVPWEMINNHGWQIVGESELRECIK